MGTRIQEFGNFEDVTSIASNSSGMLAVYDNNMMMTLFHYKNSQCKQHHQFAIDRVPYMLPAISIALDDSGRYLLAPRFTAGFYVYSSNGKYQRLVSVKDPKEHHEIKGTLYISTTNEGKILAGSVTRDKLSVLTILDAKCSILKTILISIFPLCLDDMGGTHAAVSNYTAKTKCACMTCNQERKLLI